MSDVDVLRAAATRLRDSAKQAGYLNGARWFHSYGAVRGADQLPALITRLGVQGTAAAEYAALVEPGVGLALADWLDEEASRIELAVEENEDARAYEPPLRLAERVMAGDPS